MSVVLALMSTSRARAIREDSAQAQAVILRRIATRERNDCVYVYEFSAGGARYHGDWVAYEDCSHHAGETITISYRRSDPLYSNYGDTLSARLDEPGLWWIIAGVCALGALVTWIWMLILRNWA